MKIGCTSAIGPVASAAAWATAATITIPMPASQTRRLIRSAMSDMCMDRSAGTWAAARRVAAGAVAEQRVDVGLVEHRPMFDAVT